jgi:EAL domain-containing protein (putative c-di-GMP-specific phosphodiesterase class I)/GGDEF domain-containing protein
MGAFHGAMDSIDHLSSPDIEKALSRVCVLLRIAQIHVTYFESVQQEVRNTGHPYIFYQRPEADESRMLSFREERIQSAIAVYHVSPFQGNSDWDETELEKIQLLIKMLFVYNERMHMAQMAQKLVYMDPDLGIYNLSYFIRYCNEQIHQGSISRFAVCYFNLKRFSAVNQQLGRTMATEIMADFLHALQDKFQEGEHVCRVGGDNFIAIFYKEHMPLVMEHLQGMGFSYDKDEENRLFITTTAGYYQITEDITTASDIMDNVNLAFNLAKKDLLEPYLIFDSQMAKDMKENKMLEAFFPEALEKEEFQVYYQPKVSLKDYTLAGAEALCRWFHDGEAIMPYRFIPVFEQSKFVTMLDFYMLEHVCRDLRKWLDEGKKVVKISVNLSRRHLGDMDLLERLLSVIDSYRIPHEYIEFELTETTTDVDFKDLRQIVTGLQKAGIHTSVDDFGMGYSSLNLIRDLPWNVLKIDKSFLDKKENGDKSGKIMLSHVISMAQDLGLECLVEGVETPEQIKFLKENNCYLAQGFFFDKPLKKEEFENRLDGIQ